jgi:hypothetical protein
MCWKRAKGSVQALPLIGKAFQDITPEEVKAFWQFMQQRFAASVISKSDSTAMAAVGLLLDKLKVLDRDRFLKDFTTTLGHRIYVPFEVGVPQAGYDLWWQVLTCTHECQHVHQFASSAGSGLEFSWDYLASHAARASYEAEAYTCNLELEWWRKKAFGRTPAQYAALLTSYGCDAADIAVVTKRLALELVTIKAGGIITEATKTALGWLESNVGRLKAA